MQPPKQISSCYGVRLWWRLPRYVHPPDISTTSRGCFSQMRQCGGTPSKLYPPITIRHSDYASGCFWSTYPVGLLQAQLIISLFSEWNKKKIFWADIGDGMSYLSLLHSMTQAKQKVLPLAAYVNQTSGHYTTNEERLSEYWKNAWRKEIEVCVL